MYKVEFRTRAHDNMAEIARRYRKDLFAVDQGFSDLEVKGLSTDHIKDIGRVKEGLVYRKRVGRRRIVFMIKGVTIDIFLIEMEKDTKKDYNEWLDYVKQSLKNK